MPRLLSFAVSSVVFALMLFATVIPVAAAGQPLSVSVSSVAHAVPGRLTAVNLRLPLSVAAVDGRVLIPGDAAELVGVAPAGRGTGLRPEQVASGYAFAAYNLHPAHGQNIVQLVLDPHVQGQIQIRVLIDSLADAAGRRLASTTSTAATVGRLAGGDLLTAPSAATVPSFAPRAAAGAVRKLVGSGAINSSDLDAARYAWETTRMKGISCGTGAPDANGDGCSDAVDLQAVYATIRSNHQRASTGGRARSHVSASDIPAGHTFTVNTTEDLQDSNVGNGACADKNGKCSLRAAIQEADWDQGNDRIQFHIPGSGVPVIKLSSGLPLITSERGTLTIDGYTQPGARVNSATILTNGRPGVEVRGNGEGASEALFYITSGGNTIRGLILSYFYRGIMIDGPNAVGNKVIGNWIGFTATGTNTTNQFGVLINTGAKKNRVGTPDLADRNIIGNGKDAVNHYGPGTNGNISQNNVFCINPNGGDAYCSAAEDHNFGPKYGLIGGNGPNERNVVGHTLLQAIEYSHGWNPSLAPRADTSTKWQLNGNRLIGNWLGFKADGSYKKAWRSGEIGQYDNGQTVNVYDGSNRTLVENNWMSSVRDGVTLAAPNSTGNIIRGNHIGISPKGEAAPMPGWGVKIRWVTSYNTVVGNTISNTGAGGVGLIDPSVYNNMVSRNIVTNTGGVAIKMTKDKQNPGKGADALVRAPVITHASASVISGNGIAGASVEVYRGDRGAGASGLPVAFLGAVTADGSGHWSLNVSGLAKGQYVTALQIRPDENTSQLGTNVKVTK
jgi:CSLREA domain-containing protein